MKKLFTQIFFLLAAGLFAVNTFAQPVITSFSPASGATGSSVTITGTGFNTTAGQNIVFFGATKATVTVASATSLTVTVPIGATYQYISITNLSVNLTGFSAQPFIVTLAGNIAFNPNQDFTTGDTPASVSIGDIDGDGKSDLAVANYLGNTVSVFRNTSVPGTVSFAAKVDFTTSINPYSVSIGDIDGDGKPDLAVANAGSNSVSVFRSTSVSGTVSFATKVDFTTGFLPYSVSIGDMDGDGKPDLAVANFNSNTVSVLRSTSVSGTVSFATKVDFTTGTQPISVSIGDIDGDGKLDLAVTNYASNTVSVFRSTSVSGTVNFAAKVDFTTGAAPISVSIGDIDVDGKADLAVANNGINTVSVFRSTSVSGTASFAAKVDFTTGAYAYSVGIGDIDGDGKPDLAVAIKNSNTVSVLRSTSVSGTVSFATKADFAAGAQPYSVSIGDLDGDGKPDLTVANFSASTVSVLRQIIPPLPVITSFTPSSGCAGTASVTITGTDFTGATSVLFGGTNSLSYSVNSATQITATVGTGTTGTISVITPGGIATSGGTFTVISIPAQPGTIIGSATICSGTLNTYSITAVSGATSYTWTLPGGWTGTSTTTSINATASSTSGNVSVTANNGSCSSLAKTLAVTVTSLPAQPGTITGSAAICSGTLNTYSITAVGGATSYTWTLPAGWTGTSTTNSINATASTTSGNVSVTANNTCTSLAQTLAVTINNSIPAQPGAITGSATICSGTLNTYSIAAVSGATSYTWTLPGGWTGTSTTTSINASASATGGNVSVTANNTCSSSLAQTLAVTVNFIPAQPGIITVPPTICSGTLNTYSIAAVSGATSYTWTLPGGWTGTSTTTSINATANATSGNVSVTASNNLCGPSTAQTRFVTVNILPTQPGAISGSTTACSSITSFYSVTAVAGATSYVWTLPSGWNGASSTNSIAATPSLNGGTISVTANSACGPSTAQTLSVTLSSSPDQPGAISGSAVACSTISSTYSVAAVAGVTSYVWTLPSGWSGASATNSITATPNLNGGTISVTANNACGPSSSTTLAVTVSTLPFAVLTSPAAAICEGQNATFGIIATGISLTYQWQENKGIGFVNVANGGIYSGATAANLILTGITAAMNNYKYQCIVTNSCGVETSSSATLTVAPLPPKPTVTVSVTNPEAPVLTSSAGITYQWFKDGASFGGNTQTVTATLAGIYTIKITNSGCTSVLSDPVAIIVTGDVDASIMSSVNVYPNPGSDHVTLSLGGFEKDKPVSISIVDMQGRVMEKTAGLGQREISIDIRNYAGGKYIAWLQQRTTKVARQFIKTDK